MTEDPEQPNPPESPEGLAAGGPEDESTQMQSPHDRFVRGYYGMPENARGLLQVQLPTSLLEILRLDELTVESSHFVDEKMAELESDLLFRIPRKDRDDLPFYVHILWEHQRKRDSLMVLRMWIYLAMVYRHLVLEGNLTDGKLPFVYPIVLFQGTGGWTKGLVLQDLIDLEGVDPKLHRWVPQFEIDLIRLDEDSPRVHPTDPIARLGLGLMRAVMFREVGQWLRENMDELAALISDRKEPVVLMFHYALLSGGGLTHREFQSIIEDHKAMKVAYEPGSVVDQIVQENKQVIQKLERLEKLAKEQERKAREQERNAREQEHKVREQAEQLNKTAAHLIALGFSDAEISRITDLPVKRVEAIRAAENG